IAFVDYRMERARDGHGYGPAPRPRRAGPPPAVPPRARALPLRPAGPRHPRLRRTGLTPFPQGPEPAPPAPLPPPPAHPLHGPASRLRGAGPSAAIRAGASAFLMRSAGTGNQRFGHTGITRFAEGLEPIPSAALANPDADQLARLVALDPGTRVRVSLDCGW